jgi:hypothetical protein
MKDKLEKMKIKAIKAQAKFIDYIKKHGLTVSAHKLNHAAVEAHNKVVEYMQRWKRAKFHK